MSYATTTPVTSGMAQVINVSVLMVIMVNAANFLVSIAL